MRPLSPTWIELGGVLLEVDAVDPHVAQAAAAAQRHVVLGDLVALGQVGIEVVLAVEHRARRRAREPSARPIISPKWTARALTTGSAPGQPQAHRAGVGVGRIAERQLAAAEHLRPRLELDVDLQPDDGLVARRRVRLAHRRAALPSKPIACSSA